MRRWLYQTEFLNFIIKIYSKRNVYFHLLDSLKVKFAVTKKCIFPSMHSQKSPITPEKFPSARKDLATQGERLGSAAPKYFF